MKGGGGRPLFAAHYPLRVVVGIRTGLGCKARAIILNEVKDLELQQRLPKGASQ